MHRDKTALLGINVVGGLGVVGSYAHGLSVHAGSGDALWGSVPEGWQPLYTVSMLGATLGFFLFLSYLMLRVDPDVARMGGGLSYRAFHGIFLAILVPSALWMPLTFRWIASPGEGLWLAIRVVLLVVGVGSVALVAALATLGPREARVHHALAVIGAIAFAWQTAFLDALIWPAYFR